MSYFGFIPLDGSGCLVQALDSAEKISWWTEIDELELRPGAWLRDVRTDLGCWRMSEKMKKQQQMLANECRDDEALSTNSASPRNRTLKRE